jgi:hypothetical protein
MFGKKKKATPEQQMAVAAAEFQGQIDAALQLPDPLESYERLEEIRQMIAESNESINTRDNSGLVIAAKTSFVVSTLFGGIVIASTINPIAGALSMAVGYLYSIKDGKDDKKIEKKREDGVLAVLSAALEKQQKDIINEAPIEKIVGSAKYVEFKDQTTLLDKRLAAEFKAVTDPNYKKPLEGKDKLPKNDNGKFNP